VFSFLIRLRFCLFFFFLNFVSGFVLFSKVFLVFFRFLVNNISVDDDDVVFVVAFVVFVVVVVVVSLPPPSDEIPFQGLVLFSSSY